MANKKITELQLVSAITDALNFPVDDTLQTYRATIGQVKNYLAPVYMPPSIQKFTSGSGTYNLSYCFVVSAASATVGATYTNNSITYTVIKTIASENLVYLSGSGAPTATGTLTKASGTGDSSIIFSTYRKALYLAVKAVGAGGAGGGSGVGGGGAGGSGGTTTFGSSLITCNGGSGGTTTGVSNGGVGGGSSISTPAIGFSIPGGGGGAGAVTGTAVYVPSGFGGVSAIGGGAPSSGAGNAGVAASANSGSGGGGGAGIGATITYTGAGGGAGGFASALLHNPSATYSYTIGAAGAAGAAGGGGYVGGAGAAGIVIVEEHYQ